MQRPFSGSPTPMVSWLKEESIEDVLWIKPDTKGYKIASSGCHHSLILMDVGTEYTGAYTCIATNKAGQSIFTAHLEVDDSKERKTDWDPLYWHYICVNSNAYSRNFEDFSYHSSLSLRFGFLIPLVFISLFFSTTAKERDQSLRVSIS